ncbi:MAG: hypothetical protein ACAI35_04575 [Candidatus Methylacidiphilales bacterium]|nr:hypothetical protein [Candidatus Methylacidiphilales bacterium]
MSTVTLESETQIAADILRAEANRLEADIERMCRERDEMTAEIEAARTEHSRLTRLYREKCDQACNKQ